MSKNSWLENAYVYPDMRLLLRKLEEEADHGQTQNAQPGRRGTKYRADRQTVPQRYHGGDAGRQGGTRHRF